MTLVYRSVQNSGAISGRRVSLIQVHTTESYPIKIYVEHTWPPPTGLPSRTLPFWSGVVKTDMFDFQVPVCRILCLLGGKPEHRKSNSIYCLPTEKHHITLTVKKAVPQCMLSALLAWMQHEHRRVVSETSAASEAADDDWISPVPWWADCLRVWASIRKRVSCSPQSLFNVSI